MSRWRLPLLGLALGPLLAGCMSLSADLEIRADQTVRFDVEVSLPREQFTQLAADADLCEHVAMWLPAGTVVEPAETAGELSCRASGEAPTSELGRAQTGMSGLIIVRGNGEYTFVWAPMSGAEVADEVQELELTLTFPGPVTRHKGTASVWLNTITWRDPSDLFVMGGISASGEDRPGMLQTLFPASGAAAGLAVLWIAAWLTSRSRARRRTRRPPAPDSGAPADASPSTRDTTAALQQPQTWAPTASQVAGPSPPPARPPHPPEADSPWAPP